jgi:hypothetical protein
MLHICISVPPDFLHIGTQNPTKPETSEYATERGHSRANTPKFYLLHRMQTTMKCVLFATRCLLQRNELVATNTGTAVASGLVSHGKLGKVVANHFSLKTGCDKAAQEKTRQSQRNPNKKNKKCHGWKLQQTLISTLIKNWPL